MYNKIQGIEVSLPMNPIKTYLKVNCWEYKKCGYGPNGHQNSRTICPAALVEKYNGINNGNNAGRYCWKVTGVLCHKNDLHSLPAKLSFCLNCDFFRLVSKQEGDNFEI